MGFAPDIPAVAPRPEDISVLPQETNLRVAAVTPPITGGFEPDSVQEGFVPDPVQRGIVPLPPPPTPESDQGRVMSGINTFLKSIGREIADLPKTAAILSTQQVSTQFGIAPGTIPSESHPLFGVGQDLAQGVEEIFPTNPEFQDEFLTKLIAEAGQLGVTIGVGVLTGGLGAAAQASTSLATKEYESAKASGSSEEEAFSVFLLNLPVGAADAIPVGRLLRRVDKVTGGSFKKVIAKGLVGSIEEGLQEASQEAMSNVIAGQTYDEARKIMDGVLEAGALGGILGGVATGVGVGVKTAAVNAKDRAELADATEAAKYVDDAVEGAKRQTPSTELSPVHSQSNLEEEVNDLGSSDLPPSTSSTPNQMAVDLPADQGLGTVRQKIFGFMDRRWMLPKSIQRELEHSQSQISKEVVQVQFNNQKFVDAIRKQYLGKEKQKATKRFLSGREFDAIPQAVWDAANEVLSGRQAAIPADLNVLSAEAMQALGDMRTHIDALSRTVVKEGLADGPLAAAISRNIGTYIHRTYRKHEVKDWVQQVDAQVVSRAYDFIKREYAAKGTNLKGFQINRIINDILEGPDTEFKLMSGKLGGIDTSPLRRRDNTLAPEIRALMGEFTDPLSNYVKTTAKLANIVHNGSFQQRIVERYKNIYFFEPMDATSAFRHEIAAPNNQSMGALAGLRTHKDIADAFTEYYDSADHAQWIASLIRFNSIAKYSKTVLNQVTHARNVAGGGFFMAFNGILPKGKDFKLGWKAAKAVALTRAPKEFQAQMKRYAELGLDVEGARSGEIRDVIGFFEEGGKTPFDRNFNHIFSGSRSIYSKLLLGAEAMSNIYRAEDVGIRIAMYEAELARYQEATGRKDTALEQEVADIIKKTYQDYSQVPDKIRQLSKFPLIGTFVSFQSEVVRVTFNTLEQSRAELNSENPKIRKIGRRRLTGALATIGAQGAMAAGAAILLGVGAEEDEDIKRFVAPWDRNSPLVHLNSQGTKRRYLNPSYYNPWALVTDPIVAAVQGEPDASILDRYIAAGGAFLEPFVGAEIMTTKMAEASFNQKREGGRVYNPEASMSSKGVDILAHLWDGIEPGLVSTTERVLQSIDGRRTRSGRQLSPNEEIMGWFGFRTVQIDVPISLGFRARDFASRARDAKAIYNSALRDPNAGPGEVADALDQANRSYLDAYGSAQRDMEAAARLGVSYKEIEKIMRDGGVSLDRVKQLRSRRPKRIRPEVRR